jgi:hypothetical protein
LQYNTALPSTWPPIAQAGWQLKTVKVSGIELYLSQSELQVGFSFAEAFTTTLC